MNCAHRRGFPASGSHRRRAGKKLSGTWTDGASTPVPTRNRHTGDAQLTSGPCHVTNRHHRRRHHRRHDRSRPRPARPSRHRLRASSLCGDGDLVRQRRPAVRQQRRSLEQHGHRPEGPALDAHARRPAAAQSRADLAQVLVDGRIPAPDSRLPGEHRRNRAARALPRASICFRSPRPKASTSIWSGAASCTSTSTVRTSTPPRKVNELLREGGLDRQCGRRERTARHRAYAARRFSRRILHAVRFDRRHPQVHARAGAQACVRHGVEFHYDTQIASIEPSAEGALRCWSIAKAIRSVSRSTGSSCARA